MYYTIKQMAKMFDVTEYTLRFYTDEGLLPCERDGGNRRVFNEEAYKRVVEAKATAMYMDDKVAHYETILAGLAPDDTNPKNRTAESRPKH